MSSSLLLSYSQQQFHRQLIEALVSEAALSPCAELRDQRLAVRGGVPLSGAFLQDQVRAHASAREVADAVVVLGPVGMRVEMPRAGVSDVLEEFHQPEGG